MLLSDLCRSIVDRIPFSNIPEWCDTQKIKCCTNWDMDSKLERSFNCRGCEDQKRIS